jgi:seryl-tRNA synthetase
MKSTSLIDDIRSMLNVSQGDFAELMTMTRSNVAKIEWRGVGLNKRITDRLHAVFLPEKLKGKKKKSVYSAKDADAKVRKELKAQISDLSISLNHTKKRLEAMREEWQAEMRALDYLASLKTGNKAKGKDREVIAEWVDRQQAKKLKRMSKFHPSRQELLKCRIAGLEAEIRFARNLLTPKRVRVAASVKS